MPHFLTGVCTIVVLRHNGRVCPRYVPFIILLYKIMFEPNIILSAHEQQFVTASIESAHEWVSPWVMCLLSRALQSSIIT